MESSSSSDQQVALTDVIDVAFTALAEDQQTELRPIMTTSKSAPLIENKLCHAVSSSGGKCAGRAYGPVRTT